jgi:hypothetical protein
MISVPFTTLKAHLPSHERDTVEPRHAGADVKLPGYELVLVVAPFVELAS